MINKKCLTNTYEIVRVRQFMEILGMAYILVQNIYCCVLKRQEY